MVLMEHASHLVILRESCLTFAKDFVKSCIDVIEIALDLFRSMLRWHTGFENPHIRYRLVIIVIRFSDNLRRCFVNL